MEDVLVVSERFLAPVAIDVGAEEEWEGYEESSFLEEEQPDVEGFSEEEVDESDWSYEYELSPVLQLSKSVSIGDSETFLSDFFYGNEELDPDYTHIWDDGHYTTYQFPPVRFISGEGVIKLISWGRSGIYEDWVTKEGIGRYSTLDEAITAYSEFEFSFMYSEGAVDPVYMVVQYEESLLIFEFDFEQQVSLIVLCSPEMQDVYSVKDAIFSFENLEERPY